MQFKRSNGHPESAFLQNFLSETHSPSQHLSEFGELQEFHFEQFDAHVSFMEGGKAKYWLTTFKDPQRLSESAQFSVSGHRI